VGTAGRGAPGLARDGGTVRRDRGGEVAEGSRVAPHDVGVAEEHDVGGRAERPLAGAQAAGVVADVPQLDEPDAGRRPVEGPEERSPTVTGTVVDDDDLGEAAEVGLVDQGAEHELEVPGGRGVHRDDPDPGGIARRGLARAGSEAVGGHRPDLVEPLLDVSPHRVGGVAAAGHDPTLGRRSGMPRRRVRFPALV
jgi:hypothetical protein